MDPTLRQWFAAVAGNDEAYVRENVDTFKTKRDHVGRTALMVAVLRGHTNLLPLLMPHEARLQNTDGFTALMFAAALGNLQAARLLAPEEAGLATGQQVTALMCAASTDQPQVAKLLLKREAGLVNDRGHTALMIAAAQGGADTVGVLLKREFSVLGHRRKNVIMEAAASAKPGVLATLLAHLAQHKAAQGYSDVDLGRQDADGHTALYHAFAALDEVVELEEQDQQNAYLLDCLRCINQLFDAEKDVVGADGVTALMLAAKYGGDHFVAGLLHQCGRRDSRGRSAIHYAAEYGQLRCLRLLIQYEVQAQDNEGTTACMLAIASDEDECFELLVTQEFELVDAQGNTPFHVAAEYGNLYALKKLKDRFVGRRNGAGETAFMRACRTAQMHCLVNIMEEADAVDAAGRTPLMHAVASDNLELVEILFEKYKNAADAAGLNATCHAFRFDSVAVALWLLFRERQGPVQPVFVAVQHNSFRLLKAIADVARMARTRLLPGTEFSAQEQMACQAQLHAVTRGFQGYPDGYDPLLLAAYLQQDEATQVLSFSVQSANDDGVTPLMAAAQVDCELGEETIRLLCQKYSGLFLKRPMGGFQAQTTALMIACALNVRNEALIHELVNYERDCLDKAGKKAADYARLSDRAEVVQLFE